MRLDSQVVTSVFPERQPPHQFLFTEGKPSFPAKEFPNENFGSTLSYLLESPKSGGNGPFLFVKRGNNGGGDAGSDKLGFKSFALRRTAH